MAGYFENFPLIRYGNTYAINITTRVGITEETLKNTYAYYPYELKKELRPDSLAHFYYGDVLNNWIFFISNNIVDPYYQWYNTNEEINALIESKYGSLVKALQRIHHWEVNWIGDDRIINPSVYNSFIVNVSTGVNQKKYWAPVYDVNSFVVGYQRKKIDYQVDTNRIVSFDTAITSGNNFFIDERVIQSSGGIVSAAGFVDFKSTTNDTLVLKNISGTFSNASLLIGEESSTQASFTTITTLSQSFPTQEAEYWSPVSFYDYELEQNEQRRTINVIDKNFVDEIESSLIRALK
jgi:hypothetical protein